MKMIEDQLEAIDKYFEGKKQSDFYVFVGLLVVFVGYVAYAYLIPMTQETLKRTQKSKAHVEKKLEEEKRYLTSVTVNGDERYVIKKIEAEIGRLKKSFAEIKEINEYSDFQIRTLSELLFNEQNWAKFLDSIALKARNNRIDIAFIGNKFVQNQESFGHVLEIEVGCEGTYKNLIKFMNEIEESSLVVDIYDINLQSDELIAANFKVSVWGINY